MKRKQLKGWALLWAVLFLALLSLATVHAEGTELEEEEILILQEEPTQVQLEASALAKTGTGEGAVFGIAVMNKQKPVELSWEGNYTSVLATGTYKNQKPSLVYAAPSSVSGLQVIEAWRVQNLKNNTQLTMTARLNTLPTLGEGESLAFYPLNNGALADRPVMEDVSADDLATIQLAFKSNDGIALVRVAADPGDLPVDGNIIWANSDIYLTGKMPGNAVVDATPVTVEIDGEIVLAAYDVKIYTNAKQREKGKTWQPSDKKVQVHFFDKNFDDGQELNIYHLADSAAQPEKVATVTAEDNWITFEADSFSTYAVTTLEKIVEVGGDTYKVTVTFDSESGIPADAELTVSEMTAEDASFADYAARATQTTGANPEDVEFTHAFDISLTDPNTGEHIQPGKDVWVSVQLIGEDKLNAAAEINVVHFGDQVEQVESRLNGSTVEFATDSFSMFVVQQVRLEKIISTPDGMMYKITVEYDSNSGFPEDAEINAEEVPMTSQDYRAYLTETATALNRNVSAITYTKMFDISIVDKAGVEYQPNDDVKVTVTLLDQEAESVSNLRVVHFGAQTQELDAVTENTTVSFDTDGFSLFSFSDFTTKDELIYASFGGQPVQPQDNALQVLNTQNTAQTLNNAQKFYEDDNILISGSMPPYGIVEAVPAQVQIEDEDVLLAYDIKIYANREMKDAGINWQPSAGALTVQMNSDVLEDGKRFAIYHMEDANSEPEFVALASAADHAITFDASSFSIYPITDGDNGNNARIAYEFYYNDGESDVLLTTQYFRYKDLHPTAKLSLHDPSIPGIDSTAWTTVFRGWSKNSTHDNGTLQTVEQLNEELLAKPQSAFVEGTVIKLYANLENVYYITYVDINPNNVLYTQIVPKATTGQTTFTVPTEGQVRPSITADDELQGWYDLDNQNTVYTPGQENATVSSNMKLYPKINGGYWLIFDDNDPVWSVEKNAYVSGGASFTPPVFYLDKVTAEPAAPTWEGHVFKGWYTDPEGTTPFVFGNELDANTTVYAKWEPGPSSYRVVYWKQRATDEVGIADDEKTYDYAGSRLVDQGVLTDDQVELDESDTRVYGAGGSSGEENQQYFFYNAAKTDQEVVVKADGSTVLNVYYDRQTITINFTGNLSHYEETSDTTGELYAYVNGEFVRVYPDGNGGYETRSTVTRTENVTHDYTGTRYNTTTSNNTTPQQYGVYDNAVVQLYYHTNNGGHWSRRSDHRTNTNNDQRYTDTRYVVDSNGNYGFVNGSMIALTNGTYTTTETITETVSTPVAGPVYKIVTRNGLTLTGLYERPMKPGEWPSLTNGHWWKFTGNSGRNVLLNAPWNSYTVSGNASNDQISARTWELDDAGSSTTSGQQTIYHGEDTEGEYSIILAAPYRQGATELLVNNNKFYGYRMLGWRHDEGLYGGDWHDLTTVTSDTIPYDGTTDWWGNFTANSNYYKEIHIYYYREKFDLTFYYNSDRAPSTVKVPYEKVLAEYEPDSNAVGQKRGYYFDGWYADPSCTEPFDFSQTMPHNNVAVYGKWKLRRVRVVIVPGADNVYMGSQALRFRMDYDETMDGGLLTTAQRAGYTLDGWYSDPEFNHRFLFTNPITDETDDVAWDYQEDRWTAARVAYGDDDESHDNVRGILHLYAKWIPDTSSQGVIIEYEPGDAAVYDSLGDLQTQVPVDPSMHAFTDTPRALPAPSNYNDLYEFQYWEATLEDGSTIRIYPGDAIRLNALKQYDVVMDDTGENVQRYTVKLRAIYDMTGDPARKTTITYDGNTFMDDMYIGGEKELKGMTKDGTQRMTVTLNEEVNQTIILPDENDFYLDGWKLAGWSFTEGAIAKQNADETDDAPNLEPGQKVAADNEFINELNNEGNTLYAMWEPKQYTVTVRQVVDSRVPNKNFTYVHRYGVEDQLSTTQEHTQSLNGNSEFTVDGLEYYNRVGHVFRIDEVLPTPTENDTYAVRVNAVVTRDDGTTEVLNLTSLGNYPILGDVVITYTYSMKVEVKLQKRDATNHNTVLTGATFDLIPVEFNSSTNKWDNVGDGTTITVNSATEIKWLQEGAYRIVETGAPTDYAKISTELYLTVRDGQAFTLSDASSRPISTAVAELDGSTGKILTVYDKPIRTVTLKKVLEDAYNPDATFAFVVTVYDENNAAVRNYDVGGGTTDGNGQLRPTLGNNGTLVLRIPHGYKLKVEETGDAKYTTSYQWNSNAAVEGLVFGETPEAVTTDSSLTYTNTRKTSEVTVRKILTDPFVKSATFQFAGTLMDNGTDVTDKVEDLGSFTITADVLDGENYKGEKTFNVPVGAVLSVTENANADYDTTVSSAVTISETGENTIIATNIRKIAKLTITKDVRGEWSDFNKPFTFTLKSVASEAAGAEYAWTKGENSGKLSTSVNNTFELSNGESIEITFPQNKELAIAEDPEEYADVWRMGSNTVEGTDFTVTLTENGSVVITNTQDPVAPTGVNLRMMPYALMMIIGLALVSAAWYGKKRRMKEN